MLCFFHVHVHTNVMFFHVHVRKGNIFHKKNHGPHNLDL